MGRLRRRGRQLRSVRSDVEGQTRRLRAGDGTYFTQFGARKLAHYVERELQRWLTVRPVTAALPGPEETPKVEAAAPANRKEKADNARARQTRPLSGPTLPLLGERAGEADELWAQRSPHPIADAMAAKVLVKGEAVRAPAGRADDFAWPRRDVAPPAPIRWLRPPNLPMTPMQEKPSAVAAARPAPGAEGTKTAAAEQARPVVVRRPQRSYADSTIVPTSAARAAMAVGGAVGVVAAAGAAAGPIRRRTLVAQDPPTTR